MRRIPPCFVVLVAIAALANAEDRLTPNAWRKVEIDWPATLAKHVPDVRWVQTDGYSDNAFRTKTGEVLIRTGIESKALGTSPGFYTNATVAWKPGTNAARVVEIANWGGGSYGHGKLLPAFAEHPTPSPRHTYDGICYVPGEDAMYLMLGANLRIGGTGCDDAAKAQLAIDNGESTWRFDFASSRWTRIERNVRQFWPGGSTVSPYESHLAHWPEANKLLFFDDNGRRCAEFDLRARTWAQVEPTNPCPMRLYNARSAWDAKRGLWVFRLGPKLCRFDPRTRTFETLPDCWTDLPPKPADAAKSADPRWASKGICWIDRHDAYLVTGPTGNDTRIYDVPRGQWSGVSDHVLDLPNGYCQYDPGTDRVLMNYQLQCFELRYVPKR